MVKIYVSEMFGGLLWSYKHLVNKFSRLYPMFDTHSH